MAEILKREQRYLELGHSKEAMEQSIFIAMKIAGKCSLKVSSPGLGGKLSVRGNGRYSGLSDGPPEKYIHVLNPRG